MTAQEWTQWPGSAQNKQEALEAPLHCSRGGESEVQDLEFIVAQIRQYWEQGSTKEWSGRVEDNPRTLEVARARGS